MEEKQNEGNVIEKKEAVRWAIERVIEVIAEADQLRQDGETAIGQRLANLAGHMIYSMYDAFDLHDPDGLLGDLEEVRGSIEATESWEPASEIRRLHRAFNRWTQSLAAMMPN